METVHSLIALRSILISRHGDWNPELSVPKGSRRHMRFHYLSVGDTAQMSDLSSTLSFWVPLIN
jgi:hypothetical protein